MAGVATPALAAAVTQAGGLGSMGLATVDAEGAAAMIADLRARTDGPYNVNLFLHRQARPDPAREAPGIAAMGPLFAEFGATPPAGLRAIYPSFAEDEAMLALLLDAAPPVVSFHFGLPAEEKIRALKARGCALLATATSLAEAEAAKRAGIDAVVAQGWEAGGHRGVFDPEAPDDRLGTLALTRLLAARSGLPVIAAGGIMDGSGLRAALDLGAVAGQLGTAFIACPESAADAAYRAALTGPGAEHTVMTAAISGRPARSVANRFTRWGLGALPPVPDYPIAYDAGKALIAAARAAGETGFAAQWAGQGAPLSRAMPAADLVRLIAAEAGLSPGERPGA